ncbi:helix-turn-helix domain-containing protein [Frigoribacterium sp. Leaf172]|uniref:AraC family transcriptional regulator n=1 Tax=Frigoribacterium sp. Leaf172 TaxID=1736285 RepID=UPI0007016752|nr:helix-turn-helix domain-containing protein [Frigoribacterium sp. Leaf172]KQR65762.1 hypothetical protein ASF89_00750 [Frigoribacterium sp. Leaf172]
MPSTYRTQNDPQARFGGITDEPPSLPENSFNRQAWSGADIDNATAQLEAALEGRQFRARLGADPFSFRFAAAGDARLNLQTGTFTGHLQGVIPWSRDYVVSWFPVGGVTIDYPQGQLSSVGGRPFLTPTETSYSFTMTPHRHGIAQFGSDFFESVAAARHGGPPQRLVFDYTAVPTDGALAGWSQTLGRVTPVIVSPSSTPDARVQAQTDLANAVLDLFPWRAVNVPASLRTEYTRKLRLAAEYVHTYVEQSLTSAEIAQAADMHPRTLQQQMHEYLGSTPSLYVRNVRLDRVRLDLQDAEPGSAFVADIARRWGFRNLGRFSAAYFARFGEHPRDTLRQ